MKILFFYQHFWPDSSPYANMLRVLGKGMYKAGHDVSILTGQPSYKFSDFDSKSPDRELLDGIEIMRLTSLPFCSKFRVVNLANKLVFPVRAFLYLCYLRLLGTKFDLVIAATIPPVINGLFGWFSSVVLGGKFVYHLQDMYPEIGVTGGIWTTNSWKYILLLKIDSFVVRRSAINVVLSHDMAQSLTLRSDSGTKVSIINNFMLDTFENSIAKGKYSENLPLAQFRQRLLFAGNLGRFQNLELLLKTFLELDYSQIDLEFHFLGEGSVKSTLKEQSYGCDRVFFHNHMPFEDAQEFIRKFDVGVVSIAPNVYRYAYPSKTLTYLGLGLPIIALVEPHAMLAHEIENNNLGIVVRERTSEAVRSAYQSVPKFLGNNANHRSNAQNYYNSNYSQEIVLRKWLDLINSIVR